MSSEILYDKVATTWNEYFLNYSHINQNHIEQMTINGGPLWKNLRCGRITATKAHSILVRRPTSDLNNLIKSIMGYQVNLFTLLYF